MAMNFPAISQVDAYWEGLRDGRLMPKRSEVDPRGLQGALEYAMLLEMVAPGVARVRVAGVHLSDILGMEVRGMPLTAYFEPKDRPQVAALLNEVAGQDGSAPKVVEITLTSPAGLGRPEMNAKLYLAPLESERDGRPRILGCLQSRGAIGRVPRRFQVADVHKRRIVAAAGTHAPTADAAPLTEPQSAPQPQPQSRPAVNPVPNDGFAEVAARFNTAPNTAPARAAPSERPHLRLVKSDGGSA